MENSAKKRILICPLDWGLGHATRCIPIIRFLQNKNLEVIIAADKAPLELLKKEFPNAEFIRLSGYEITYPDKGFMALKMFAQIPKIIRKIKSEHIQLEKIISEKRIDAVISDNRYGLWTNKIPSVFITHQLSIQAPFGKNWIRKIIFSYIKKYDECWIPDVANENNFSGNLSHGIYLLPNTFFIGTLSRFNKNDSEKNNFEYNVMVLISGPEPQRTNFEKIIFQQFKNTSLKAIVVLGIPESAEKYTISNNIQVFSHLDSQQMQKYILASEIIISRSGYSSIMDLACLQKKAVLIPTSGQTEQEYLARYLADKKIIYSVSQNKFKLVNTLQEAKKTSGFVSLEKNYLFENVVEKWLQKNNFLK
ncbi:MAG TPA: glycosyltransferase [Bacteroidia bacterium]|nr:glycosyltransferase [Bacteroidia bacterium]